MSGSVAEKENVDIFIFLSEQIDEAATCERCKTAGAEWVIRIVCCGATSLFCTPCKDALAQYVRATPQAKLLACVTCHVAPVPDPVYTAEKI